VIDALKGEQLRVSAEHPKWGVAHGEVKIGEEVVLRMQPPGSLQGLVTENGKPPELGKYTIAVVRRRGNDEPRGPLETTPMLVSPGVDGTFTVKVLQPGTYNVAGVKALDALRSPGGLVSMMQDMFMMRNLPDETVQVMSGQAAQVRLETGEKPIEGPTARLSGSVTVDGKLGSGFGIMVNGKDRQFSVAASTLARCPRASCRCR
jgi:phage baseplate assembly protein gpV